MPVTLWILDPAGWTLLVLSASGHAPDISELQSGWRLLSWFCKCADKVNMHIHLRPMFLCQMSFEASLVACTCAVSFWLKLSSWMQDQGLVAPIASIITLRRGVETSEFGAVIFTLANRTDVKTLHDLIGSKVKKSESIRPYHTAEILAQILLNE